MIPHYVEAAEFPAPRRACSVEAMIGGRASAGRIIRSTEQARRGRARPHGPPV